MKVWITTDPHFYHEAIREYCGRPDGFEQTIFLELQKVLSEKTMLICLGDVALYNCQKAHDDFIKPLPGKKILVMGNHDSKSYNWYMNNGWDFICEWFHWDYMGKRILFSHKPMPWDGFYDVNIHGHFHNTDHRRNDEDCEKFLNKGQKLIAIEHTEYKPVSLESILNGRKK